MGGRDREAVGKQQVINHLWAHGAEYGRTWGVSGVSREGDGWGRPFLSKPLRLLACPTPRLTPLTFSKGSNLVP